MAGFRKAKAEQAAIKMGLYGPPGSGKTFTALLLAEGLAKLSGKRIAYIDTERGTDFYCQTVPTRPVHPDAFDFDAIYTRSLSECLKEIRHLDTKQHGVIVLDSVTHLWEAAMAAYGGKLTSIGTIPMHAWGKIKKPYKDLMGLLLSLDVHVLICGRQKIVYQEDEETEELKAVGVTMRAEGETPYEPHILMRMEAVKPKRTNETATIYAYAEKDRTGVLSGRSFANPTYDSICKPLLGLLGGTQAKMDTIDETSAKDAEAAATDEADRSERSTELLREWSAKIDLAKTAKELKEIGKEITPALKARMLPVDVASLRDKYHERDATLGKNGAPPDEAAALKQIERLDSVDACDTAADMLRSFPEGDGRTRLEGALKERREQLTPA